VNAKIDKKNSCITKINCKHSKGGYGRLLFGNVYTCHGFFQRMHEFKEADSKTFFHKLIQQFVDKEFGNLWQPTINRIYETSKIALFNSR
jgi:hypothetical protein